ncbi:hypothetical protein [Helicobacter brantae]|uniref:Porin n=1 Tax=Helicobacter brantae TaxID=375927 RepID=A0A3D8J2L2_9HELI|nr:hypothetical protein [Helicobacter brantae]RDU71757.1 hypothetical protein CQA58_01580 [Helicobacter brantae]
MRVTKISLATLLALGTLTCVNAETKLEDAIKGTTIKGYVLGQMTSQFGDDIHGNVFRTRAWANLNTGAIGGFNLGMTAYASTGGGKNSDGTPFLEASGAAGKPINIGLTTVYGKQDLSEYGSKTTIIGGKMNILTPFNDNTWDYGYGVYVSNEDIEGVKFSGQVFGAYTLDDATDATYTAGTSLDHPLYILGVEAGGEKLGGAGIKVYAAHSTKVFDYMVMGDVSYTIAGVTLQSQVAVTDVDTNGDKFYNPNGTNGVASLRGLYNIQASYANKDLGFSAKAGFTGSFGDGYGALLNYASFNMGGQFWYDTVGSKNGYGMFGQGGYKIYSGSNNYKASSIMVGYVGLQYTGVKSLKIGLDYAYVGGDNNYALAPTASQTAINTWTSNGGSATFHEVSFTASYGFFDNKLTLSGLIGSTFGDLQMARGRAVVKYSF